MEINLNEIVLTAKQSIQFAEYVGKYYSNIKNDVVPTENLLEEFLKDFMINTSTPKKFFYAGFDACENGDANCYTAWREEAPKLFNEINQL